MRTPVEPWGLFLPRRNSCSASQRLVCFHFGSRPDYNILYMSIRYLNASVHTFMLWFVMAVATFQLPFSTPVNHLELAVFCILPLYLRFCAIYFGTSALVFLRRFHFRHWQCPSVHPWYDIVYICVYIYQGYTDLERLYFVPSVWNLLDVIQLPLRILGWLLDFLANLFTLVVDLLQSIFYIIYQDSVRSVDFEENS